jgi:hypothetical protein
MNRYIPLSYSRGIPGESDKNPIPIGMGSSIPREFLTSRQDIAEPLEPALMPSGRQLEPTRLLP